MAKVKVSETKTAIATDNRHLVIVTKNGLKATVTNTSLEGWFKQGWKRLDDKAGA
jgi:hypothetical protein